jgi:ribonuclease P protein component
MRVGPRAASACPRSEAATLSASASASIARASSTPPMIGRLVQAADFQRLLATPPRGRSAHFLLHHLAAEPTRPAWRAPASTAVTKSTSDTQAQTAPAPAEDARQTPASHADSRLTTGSAPKLSSSVDNFLFGCWLGCVVPKRHARRSVTRSMLKRQMRAAAQRHEGGLAQGLWLVRLRQGFPVAQFPSADSDALRAAARTELDRLFGQAAA